MPAQCECVFVRLLVPDASSWNPVIINWLPQHCHFVIHPCNRRRANRDRVSRPGESQGTRSAPKSSLEGDRLHWEGGTTRRKVDPIRRPVELHSKFILRSSSLHVMLAPQVNSEGPARKQSFAAIIRPGAYPPGDLRFGAWRAASQASRPGMVLLEVRAFISVVSRDVRRRLTLSPRSVDSISAHSAQGITRA